MADTTESGRIDFAERTLLKLTSTKTWYLIAAILCTAASYIGGSTQILPEWLVTLGIVFGFCGGGLYAILTTIQNVKETEAKAKVDAAKASATTQAINVTSDDKSIVKDVLKTTVQPDTKVGGTE